MTSAFLGSCCPFQLIFEPLQLPPRKRSILLPVWRGSPEVSDAVGPNHNEPCKPGGKRIPRLVLVGRKKALVDVHRISVPSQRLVRLLRHQGLELGQEIQGTGTTLLEKVPVAQVSGKVSGGVPDPGQHPVGRAGVSHRKIAQNGKSHACLTFTPSAAWRLGPGYVLRWRTKGQPRFHWSKTSSSANPVGVVLPHLKHRPHPPAPLP
mmetsp:Transcript_3227/g.7614  ORF Transcript_3227/g.7614 Transcript_3227/m.7614 type:complete len:207 (+) Transcript_3227:680-1300(+)